jgi:hypothetical protein
MVMAAIIGRVSAHEGYVGLTQAEARIFITERVPFSALGVAWRIASDVEAIEVGAEMRQSLVANKLNRTVINRCGKNNSEQSPKFAVAILVHSHNQKALQRQAVDTSLGKGVDSGLLGLRRKSRDYVYKSRPLRPCPRRL